MSSSNASQQQQQQRLTAPDIIRALGGDPHTGMCCCPAHDDEHPSLHIDTGRNGKVLWHCHAGCSQEKVRAALQAKGLRPGTSRETQQGGEAEQLDDTERLRQASCILRAAHDVRPDKYFHNRGIDLVPKNACLLMAPEAKRLTGFGYPAVALPITDGERFTGVQLTFLTRDGAHNACHKSGRSVRRTYGVLKGSYISFGQLNNPSPEWPLIIGEGTETTLAAMQITGLPGIAAAGSTNLSAVRPPRSSAIIIAADNDEAGRKAAAQLAQRLHYEGRQVQIALPPVEGHDWNKRLLEAEDAAAEWEAAVTAPPAPEDPPGALELSDFMALEFPQRELLLAPWLPHPGIVIIHAQRGNGKTYFALAVGNAVAAGSDLCDWCGERSARVLYVDGEMPGAALQDRLNKLSPMPRSQFYVLSRDRFLLHKQGKGMPDLGEPEGRQELDRIIEECQPDLLILDSLSTLVRSGIENEAESWAPIQDWLLTWRWRGLSIILLHHEGKSGKPRGTSKREDVIDTMLGLRLLEEQSEEGQRSVFELRFTKHRDFFGEAAAPMHLEFQVVAGRMLWSPKKIKDVRKEQIRALLEAGLSQVKIGKELGLSRGRVSQIVQQIKIDDSTSREDAREPGWRG